MLNIMSLDVERDNRGAFDPGPKDPTLFSRVADKASRRAFAGFDSGDGKFINAFASLFSFPTDLPLFCVFRPGLQQSTASDV
jgi:hypothetical protein